MEVEYTNRLDRAAGEVRASTYSLLLSGYSGMITTTMSIFCRLMWKKGSHNVSPQ